MPGTTPDRSSAFSPSAGATPSWARPRSPLPPARLAKLANALGVPTPMPAAHAYAVSLASPPLCSRSTSPSYPDHFRRSPTPSAASAQTYMSSSSSTKYLLHVIPPTHLPHDPDDSDLLSPPSGASGYHTQFRRGVLVPVYSTLSSQLAAIAKEYALPSTVGLILYLVITSGAAKPDAEPEEEPGPRISDEIWRRIWHRVVKADKEEALSPGPRPLGLGLGSSSPAAPSLIHEVASLRPPLPSPGRIESPQSQMPMTPSPSTASHSVFSSQSEVETPESMSSVPDGLHDDLPLPGLRSPALIPILAKVEFDIDRRKAGWYEPWVRSRRASHAKRAESRNGMRKRTDEDDGGDGEDRRPPFDLTLVERLQDDRPSFLRERDVPAIEDPEGYAQLQDEVSDIEDPVPITQLPVAGGDPLADVFGTDEETWADMRAGHKRRPTNPNIVDLALDGQALSASPVNLEEDQDLNPSNDEEEVTELWNARSRPSLVVSIPSPPSTSKRRSSPTATTHAKRQPPPPLNLLPARSGGLAVQSSPNPGSSPGSAHLAYLDNAPAEEESVEDAESLRKVRSPEEEKRDGAFFEELDLGLRVDDDTEFDENDPNDRRRSQYLMKQQLDELEKSLVQLSPRKLQMEAFEDSPTQGVSSATLSPPKWVSPSRLALKTSGSGPPTSEGSAQWPAVPYSAMSATSEFSTAESTVPSGSKSRPQSPPRIALHGVPTQSPRGVSVPRSRSGTLSNETLAHKREQDELYPPLIPPTMLKPKRDSHDSPIIPLSPDPFGRFPSEPEANRLEDEKAKETVGWSNGNSHPALPRNMSFDPETRANSQTPSSRFSLDSVASEEGKSNKAASLVSMKSIKKLWRKTNSKLSLSGGPANATDSGRSSPNYPGDQHAGRRMSRTSTKSPQLSDQGGDFSPPHRKRNTSIRSVQFMHDHRESLVPSRTPPLDVSRQPSPASSYMAGSSPQPPPLSTSPSPNTSPNMSAGVPPSERNSSNGRKSILKSWKSASGSLSVQNVQAATPTSSSTPRSSQELLNDGGMRRRRPSIAETGGVPRRGSVLSSGSATLGDIPPSPALPEEFVQTQVRKRNSQSNLLNGGRMPTRQRLSPSISSVSTTVTSPPRQNGRLTPGDSPPRGGVLSRRSQESMESRPSFDVSQFEMVSPKADAFRIENTLTYPYHTLDHAQ